LTPVPKFMTGLAAVEKLNPPPDPPAAGVAAGAAEGAADGAVACPKLKVGFAGASLLTLF